VTVRVLLATLLVSTGLAAVPASGAACATRHDAGRWATFDVPAKQTIQLAAAYASSPSLPDTLFAFETASTIPATEGGGERDVMRSDDGGCTWVHAYSLSALPPTSRMSMTGRFTSVTVVQRSGRTPPAVYAVAIDTESALTVAAPVTTVVSLDGGRAWHAYDPAAGDAAADVPRCTTTELYPGLTARTAYLYCANDALGEAFDPLRCRVSYWTTTDAGATWRPVAPEIADLAHVEPPPDPMHPAVSYGCGPAAQLTPARPDTAVPNVLWDTAKGPGPSTILVTRSTDGGATWRSWVAVPSAYAYQLHVSTPPGRTPVVVGHGNSSDLGWSVGGGPFRIAPPIRVRSAEKGVVTTVCLVPGSDLLVAAYFDGKNQARLFTYDVRHGRDWVERQRPPTRGKTKAAAWDQYGGNIFVADARSPYVYLRFWGGGYMYRFDTRGSR
jgi:hypothetical protein